MRKILFALVFSIFSFFGIISCSQINGSLTAENGESSETNLLSGSDNNSSGNSDKCLVSFSVKYGSSSRMILPSSLSKDELYYSISITDSNDVVTSIPASSDDSTSISHLSYTELGETSIYLQKASYTLTVKAYLSATATSPVLLSSKTVDFSTDSTTVSFDLEEAPDVTGGMTLYYQLPSSSSGLTASFTLKKYDTSSSSPTLTTIEEAVSATIDSSTSLPTTSYSKDSLSPGLYVLYIKFTFTSGSSTLTSSIPETIRVTSGRSTSNSSDDPIVISDEQLNQRYSLTLANIDGSGNSSTLDYMTFYMGQTVTLPESSDYQSGHFDKIFVGWFESSDSGTTLTGDALTSWEATSGDKTLYGKWLNTTLYVSSGGSDSNDGLSSSSALASLSQAVTKLNSYADSYGLSNLKWTFVISGNITGSTEITSLSAKKLSIIGATSSSYDQLLGASSLSAATSPVLTIGSSVSSDIVIGSAEKGLMIKYGTGGITYAGSGSLQFIGGCISLNSDSGLKITGSGNVTIKTSSIGLESSNYNTTSGNGGGIYMAGSGTLFLDRSTVCYNRATGNGGGIYASSGKVKLSDATIKYNSATLEGGGIYSSVALTMLDGAISYNSSSQNGGGALINGSIDAKLNGVTVNFNETGSTSYSGGGLYFASSGILTLTDCKFDTNIAGKNGGGLCLPADSSGVAKINGSSTFKGNSAGSNGGGVYNGGSLFLYGSAVIGNKDATAVASASAFSNSAVSGGGIFNSSSGKLYIGYSSESNVDTSFSGGIYYNYASSLGPALYSSSSLCKMAAGNIKYNFANANASYGSLSIAGTFDMYGGRISNNSGKFGGGIGVKNGSLNIYGGEISSNTASSYGGGIYVYASSENGSSVNISGGSISSNSADSSGGGLYLCSSNTAYKTSATITGGEISSNTAGFGAGAYGDRCSTFIMSDGSISDNAASYNGGGILIDSSSPYYGVFVMTGGKISGNSAEGHGGGIFTDGNVYISASAVIGDTSLSCPTSASNASNKATDTNSNGGGIYNNAAGSLFLGYTLDSSSSVVEADFTGSIWGNYAVSGGGIFNEGNLTIAKATIKNNAGYASGGGIYNKKTMVMTGGEISSNTAVSGGGLYLYSSDSAVSTFSMSGSALISPNGSSAGSNNDVYLSSASVNIAIPSALTSTAPVAIITPSSYSSSTVVLTGDALASQYSKFSVTPDASGGAWTISSSGALTR